MVVITSTGQKLVTVIPGDGIGPECIEATQRIIAATGAPIAWEERHANQPVSVVAAIALSPHLQRVVVGIRQYKHTEPPPVG